MVLGKRGNRLFIGGADPTDQEAVERIKFATQLSPEWVIVEYDKLVQAARSPGRQRQRGDGVSWPAATSSSTSPTKTPRAQEGAEVSQEVEDAPVVRFLQKMLIDAINARASDLHFEPYEYNYRVRFRIDGELREITQPPIAIKDKLASRIKVISPPGHRREARAAGRPHEAEVRQQGDRLPRSARCPRCSARRS